MAHLLSFGAAGVSLFLALPAAAQDVAPRARFLDDEVFLLEAGGEAAALVDLEHRLAAFRPFGDTDSPPENAGLDAHVRDGFGEAERAAR